DRPVRPVRLPAGHDRRWWRQIGELLRFCRGGRQETLPGEVDTGLEPRSEGERVGVPGDPAILEGKPGEDTHHVEVVEPVVEETTGGLEVAAPLLGPEDNRVELATVTLGGRHDGEEGAVGEPGLDSVGALVLPEHQV